MEIQGKVKALLPEQTGTSSRTGNSWKSQEFVLDYFWWPNQVFASQMVLKMFGEDRIAQWNLQVNDEVKIRYHIEAHEYQGRWFNDIRAYNVIRGQQPVAAAAAPAGAPVASPFPPQPNAGTDPFPPAQEAGAEGSADDLPF